MPRKPDQQPGRLLKLDDHLNVVAVPERRLKRRPSGARRAASRPFSGVAGESFSSIPLLLRNRSLLMAALRVWELRNGIHDGW